MQSNDVLLKNRHTRIKNIAVKSGVYFFLALWALIVLFPFYWMLLTSFKSYGAYNSEVIPKLYTLAPTLENYASAFSKVQLGTYLFNTLIFSLVTTALMLAIAIPAAYAFARMNFRGKELLFTVFLALMMIPNELVIITNYVRAVFTFSLRLNHAFVNAFLAFFPKTRS